MTIQVVQSAAMKRMIKARTSLLQTQPFWGTLALYLQLIETPEVETMSTNGTYLKFNPIFVMSLTEKELIGVLAHEVSHNAYLHHTRRGKRDPEMWNEAADYAINRDLSKANFILPEDRLEDARFDGMTAEEIYSVLKQEKQQQPLPQSGGAGSGGDKPKDKGRCGWVEDAAPPGNEAAIAKAEGEQRVRVMQAMGVEKGKNAGNLPAHLARMAETVRSRPEDWRAILRRFIDEKSRVNYSWSRPNKRLLGHGFVFPGTVPDGLNHIGMVVDTSSSIDKRALGVFLNQLQAAADDGATRKITIICCDTAVKAWYDFEEGDRIKFEIVGGGGTRFSPALAWFEKHEPGIAALIYFTDLDCSDYGPEPWVPVIWAAYGPADKIRQRRKKVPFGEVIHLID